jgi:hypothetical protein
VINNNNKKKPFKILKKKEEVKGRERILELRWTRQMSFKLPIDSIQELKYVWFTTQQCV